MSTFILKPDNARDRMAAAWEFAKQILQLGKSVRVEVEECASKRSLEQNAKMWAVLTDISRQVQWFVDGREQLIEPEDWKHILTAGLKKHQRIAAGVDGGFVILGVSTRKLKVSEMVELIDFAMWFGSEKGVIWSDDEYRNVA